LREGPPVTTRELETAAMMLDELLHGANIDVDHMRDAYWGAKALLEEMGVRVTETDGQHSLMSVAE